jgi:hypothetical protein
MLKEDKHIACDKRSVDLQVARVDAVRRDEGLLGVHDVVDAAVRMEVGLDVVEDNQRAIRAATGNIKLTSKDYVHSSKNKNIPGVRV